MLKSGEGQGVSIDSSESHPPGEQQPGRPVGVPGTSDFFEDVVTVHQASLGKSNNVHTLE